MALSKMFRIPLIYLLLLISVSACDSDKQPVKYNEYLTHMGLSPLKGVKVEKGDAIFRFHYLRTFHDPVVITIKRTKGKFTAQLCRSEFVTGYKLGKLITKQNFILSDNSTKLLTKTMNDPKYWLGHNEHEIKSHDILDGSNWVYSLKTATSYKHISIQSPVYYVHPKHYPKHALEEFKRMKIDLSKIRDFGQYENLGKSLMKNAQILAKLKNYY